jgi:hypothetical protein
MPRPLSRLYFPNEDNDFVDLKRIVRPIENLEADSHGHRFPENPLLLFKLTAVRPIIFPRILASDAPVTNVYPLPGGELLKVCLAIYRLPCEFEQYHLQHSNYDQPEIECPRPPVQNVVQKRLLLISKRYGRQWSEGYGVLFILTSYGLAIWLGGCGVYRFVYEGRRWSGSVIIALAFTLAMGATLSGGFNCLPWHWGRCGKYQGGAYRQYLQHDSQIVPQKAIDTDDPERPNTTVVDNDNLK